MCIINTTHRFVFVHVPKSAGTTVTTALGRMTTVFDLEVGGTPWGEAMQTVITKRFPLHKHATAAELRGTLGVQDWARYLTFAFVRNPYDRAWSTYKYFRQNKSQMSFIKKFKSFDAYVRSDQWDEPGPSRILRPQSAWTHNQRGELLLDVVGRVERLDADLADIVARLGPAAVAASALDLKPVERANVSNPPRDAPALSAVAVEKIATRYAEDFARFGYDPEAVPFPRT